MCVFFDFRWGREKYSKGREAGGEGEGSGGKGGERGFGPLCPLPQVSALIHTVEYIYS